MTKDELLRHLDYSQWATEKLLDKCERLSEKELHQDLGGSFGTTFSTLMHTYGADAMWLSRWQGKPKGFPEDFDSFTRLRTEWQKTHAAMKDFVEALSDHELDKVFTVTISSGASYEHPFSDMLLHVVNHGSFHRGQISHALRVLGHESVSTDFVFYLREQA